MSGRYFHSIRYYFLLSLLLFLTSLYAGYSLSEVFPVNMLEVLREVFGDIRLWQSFQLMIFIFLNNSVKCFLAILLGFTFGIVPILFVAVNGLIIGLIAYEVEKLNGLSFVLAAILPHGVIEIPVVLLSSAIGIRIGYETLRKLRGKGNIKGELRRGINFFVLWILPLLLLAAIIETFVTPLIAYSVLNV